MSSDKKKAKVFGKKIRIQYQIILINQIVLLVVPEYVAMATSAAKNIFLLCTNGTFADKPEAD